MTHQITRYQSKLKTWIQKNIYLNYSKRIKLFSLHYPSIHHSYSVFGTARLISCITKSLMEKVDNKSIAIKSLYIILFSSSTHGIIKNQYHDLRLFSQRIRKRSGEYITNIIIIVMLEKRSQASS